MPQITKTSLTFAFLLLLCVFTLSGCGSSNSQSNFDPVGGEHPAGWLPAGHKPEAVAHLEDCTQCHGADFKGGISKVACTDCHIGNQLSVHPTAWGPFIDVLHATFVRSEGTSTCANASCHGAALTGISGSGPSCTLCHLGGVNSIHPTEWGASANLLHDTYVRVNGNSACANASCHGINLTGTGGTGPSCTLCHLGGVDSIHPVNWGAYTYALHSNYARTNGTTGCANASCHGTTLTGVSGSGPSCTLCHLGGVNSKHPVAWTADIILHKGYVLANGDNSCRNLVCHGANLEGVFLSGPSCQACHLNIGI